MSKIDDEKTTEIEILDLYENEDNKKEVKAKIPPQGLDKAKKAYGSCVNEWNKKTNHDEKAMERMAIKFQEKCENKGYICKIVSGYIINSQGLVEKRTWNVITMDNKEVPVDIPWRSEERKGFGNLENTHFERKVQIDGEKNLSETTNEDKLEMIYVTVESKYGKGKGIEALETYIKTGNKDVLTRTNNARSIIETISTEEIEKFIKQKKLNEILEVAKKITNIYDTNYQKIGLSFLKDKLKHYITFKQISIFTRENNERDMIKSLDIDAIKEYLKRYYKVQV